MHSILWTWLDQYADHFFQPPNFPGLKLLLGYVQFHFPGSQLERQAHVLLRQLKAVEDPESSEEEPAEEEEDCGASPGAPGEGGSGTAGGSRLSPA